MKIKRLVVLFFERLMMDPSVFAHDQNRPRYGFADGDVVIVTGAGSGIGRAAALAAGQQGLHVACWDRAPESAAATVAAIEASGGCATMVPVELTDPLDIANAMRETHRLGIVRYLANVAGPGASAPIDFNTGLVSSVGSMRAVANAWFTIGAPGGASLVNIASLAGVFQGASSDWYCAAKAGIVGWTRHLATYRSDTIRANVVAPGMTNTPRTQAFAQTPSGSSALATIPLRRMADPSEIAAVVLFLLSPLASYVNGAVIAVDGGWSIAP